MNLKNGLLIILAGGLLQLACLPQTSVAGSIELVARPGASHFDHTLKLAQLSEQQELEVELEFWRSIKDSNNLELFKSYLKKYPNGRFADIARIKLKGEKLVEPDSSTEQQDNAKKEDVSEYDKRFEFHEGSQQAKIVVVSYINIKHNLYYDDIYDVIKRKYIDKKYIKLIHRFLPISKQDVFGIMFAYCVNNDKFFENAVLLAKNTESDMQDDAFIRRVLEFAKARGMTDADITKCAQDKELQASVIGLGDYARRRWRIEGVPSFVVQYGPNLERYRHLSRNNLFEGINQVLASSGIEASEPETEETADTAGRDESLRSYNGMWASSKSVCDAYRASSLDSRYIDDVLSVPNSVYTSATDNMFFVTGRTIRYFDDAGTQCEFKGVNVSGSERRYELLCYNVVTPEEDYISELRITKAGETYEFSETVAGRTTEYESRLCVPLADLSRNFGSLWRFDRPNCSATAPHSAGSFVFRKTSTGELVLTIEADLKESLSDRTRGSVRIDRAMPIESRMKKTGTGIELSMGSMQSVADLLARGFLLEVWSADVLESGPGEYRMPHLTLPLLGSAAAVDFLKQCSPLKSSGKDGGSKPAVGPQDIAACHSENWKVALAGCAKLIHSGTLSGKVLAETHNYRGTAYVKKGEYDLAFVDFDYAIRLDPELAAAYNNRGGIFVRRDQIDRAISDFQMAIKLKPNFWAAKTNLDRVLEIKRGVRAKTPAETIAGEWTYQIPRCSAGTFERRGMGTFEATGQSSFVGSWRAGPFTGKVNNGTISGNSVTYDVNAIGYFGIPVHEKCSLTLSSDKKTMRGSCLADIKIFTRTCDIIATRKQ